MDIIKPKRIEQVDENVFRDRPKRPAPIAGTDETEADLKTIGDVDAFELLFKKYSDKEGWMKSTKALYLGQGAGCVVQVTTSVRNPDGSFAIAEALTFVPNVCILEDINGGKCLSADLLIGDYE